MIVEIEDNGLDLVLDIEGPVMGVIKVRLVAQMCPFIRNKGDKYKSEFCSLLDGSQLCANK